MDLSIFDLNRNMGILEGLSPQDHELAQRRNRVLGPAAPLMYRRPVHIVTGEGAWLFGSDGTKYLDMYNNVASVGHGNARVAAAISAQARQLATHTRYLHASIVDYAERLVATLPASLNRVTFTCTGSEANDLAIRISRMQTGAEGVIVTRAAYHGGTSVVAACSPSSGPAAPWVRAIEPPDPRLAGGEDVGAWWAKQVGEAALSLEAAGYGVAALLIDTIFSSNGVIPSVPGALKAGIETARQHGAMFIADEVQPGFARLGEDLWGFLRHDVEPDFITMGKPMANGMPVAGLVGRSDLIDDFGVRENYFNTFGGNAVSMAAAIAVLDAIEEECLVERTGDIGRQLLNLTREVTSTDPSVSDVRGQGLFVAVEYTSEDGSPDTERAVEIVNRMREENILISTCGEYGNSLKIRPPLVVSPEQLVIFADGLSRAQEQ